MVTNPYVAHPSTTLADVWANGFLHGFASSSNPIEPPPEIDPNDGFAYSEGIQAGRQAAIDGLDVGNPCIPALEPSPGEDITHVVDGAHVVHGIWEMRHLKGLAGGVLSLVIVLIEIGVSGKHVLPLEQTALPDVANPLLDAMNSYEIGSLEVYCGAGLDALSHDCEIQITGIYPSLDDARTAVQAIGRSDWLIVSWRTDQCGSFKVVEWPEM